MRSNQTLMGNIGKKALWAVAIWTLSQLIACGNEVDFTEGPEPAPPGEICFEGRKDCVFEPKTRRVNVNGTYRVDGTVDIVFVIDNSNSMFALQSQLAPRLNGFLNSLHQLDYRIAVTTSDAQQIGRSWPTDGQFVRFPDGRIFIDKTTANAQAAFAAAITRPETQACETYIRNQRTGGGGLPSFRPGVRSEELERTCPSDDEQPILITNRVLERKDSSFFRPYGHLAFVLISNEDERSRGGVQGGLPLGALNRAESVISTFTRMFPAKFPGFNTSSTQKTLAFHSIVIKDQVCLQHQTALAQALGVTPQLGNEFARLTQLTQGILGDLCSPDYTRELSSFSDRIRTEIATFRMDCDTTDLLVDTGNPQIYPIQTGRNVVLSGPLPPGSLVRYTYTCPQFYE